MLIFDIETGPVHDELLERQFTFEPPPHPGEFDQAGVKTGHLKDQAKIAAKIEDARTAHSLAVENHALAVEQARGEAWRQFKSNAALSPLTGQVLAIGIRRGDKSGIFGGVPEPEILTSFWKKYKACRQEQTKLVGANIKQFDLPFLIRRSWMLGVSVPSTAYTYDGKWLNFDPLFFDIRDLWLLGQRSGCESSLDAMSRALGVGSKPDGINGGDFARLWLGTPAEREQATGYLLNDLKLTAEVATKLGVI